MNTMRLRKSVVLKKSMLCMFFFFLWGGFLIAAPAAAKDVTVCPSGCDNTSILAAVVDVANAGGGTVTVGTEGRSEAEIYYETFPLREGVNVVSEGDDSTITYTDPWGSHSTTVLRRATLTIIDGGGGSEVVVRCPGGTLDASLNGFTVQNINDADKFLIVIGAGSPTIANNIIRNNQGSGYSGGIGLQGLDMEYPSPVIENNFIHHVNGPGIGNGPNSEATITNNEIWNCGGPGVGLWSNASPAITNNTIFENSRAGIGSHGPASGGDVPADSADAFAGETADEGGLEAPLTLPPITGNTIRRNGQAGIGLWRASGTSGVITVTIGQSGAGNDIYDNGFAGVRLDGITDAIVRNNDLHDNHQGGIRTFSGIDQLSIEDNQIYSNEMGGINSFGASLLLVSGNRINSNGILHHHAGIRIRNDSCDATIENNTIYENGSAGVLVERSDSVSIVNNEIYSNSWAGITNKKEEAPTSANSLTVSGNNIYDNGYAGIALACGNSLTIDQRNDIYQNGYAGIAILGACTLDIADNTIRNNVRAGIYAGEPLITGSDSGFFGNPGDAHVTIKRNKVYNNGKDGYGGGIEARYASGVISNNLIYKNHMVGIRYCDWIDEIVNNTVVANGQNGTGAGIAYDDLTGAITDPPSGTGTNIPIRNNICADNELAGIFDGLCGDLRDYNLLSGNFGWDANPGCTGSPWESNPCKRQQLGTCSANGNEIFADPLFADKANDEYELQAGSPAIGAGYDGTDMGAYGGSDPMAW